MLKITQIKHGFSEVGHYASLVNAESNINKFNVILDMVKCFILYGARAQDFWRFEFYRKSRRERNRYMTNMRWLSIVKKINRFQCKSNQILPSTDKMSRKMMDLTMACAGGGVIYSITKS